MLKFYCLLICEGLCFRTYISIDELIKQPEIRVRLAIHSNFHFLQTLLAQDNWKLERTEVQALIAAVEANYQGSNPYHNATHAADVVQTTWLFIRAAAERVPFTQLEVRPHVATCSILDRRSSEYAAHLR